MKHTAESRGWVNMPNRLGMFRPRLESLEDRLPPGDVLFAAVLGPSLLEPALFRRDPAAGFADSTETLGFHETWSNPQHGAIRDVSSTVSMRASDQQPHAAKETSSAPFVADSSSPQSKRAEAPTWQGRDVFSAEGLFTALAEFTPGAVSRMGLHSISESVVGHAGGQITAQSTSTADFVHVVTPDSIFQRREPSPSIVNVGPASLPVDQDADTLPAGDLGSRDQTDVKTPKVHALFDLSKPTTGPFPSNHFTVADDTQNTGRRVNLPLPDPNTHPSDFEDTQVLNTLDGFNMQPRLSIPFDGQIDVNTVTSKDVVLISLGDTLPGGDPGGEVVGINQVVWDPPSKTLHVESDELLNQHTRYGLIVTQEIRDTSGHQVKASEEFKHFVHHGQGEYHEAIVQAIQAAEDIGIPQHAIVTASVFSTESATAILEKMRDQIHAATPAPADFLLGPDATRTVFNPDDVTGIHWEQQTGDDPPSFTPNDVNLSPLRDIFPGAVGELAFGKYLSPDYEVHTGPGIGGGEYIPQVGTRTGTPVVQGVNEIYFNLVLPSGPMPEAGWPVAIFGHGSPGNKNLTMTQVAASMADQGIASIFTNAVGMGFGPLSTLTVEQGADSAVTFPEGGRGRDQDGNHDIGANEGFFSAPPRTIIEYHDGMRQTVADLMQLVRVIEVGVDVGGDGVRALDPSRIYYFGFSAGGILGTSFMAVEPDVRSGVLNVAGGPFSLFRRLATVGRPILGSRLAARMPSLINPPGVTKIDGVDVNGPYYDDNQPLRDGLPLLVHLEDGTDQEIRSPVVNTVAGAMAIQEVLDHLDWVGMSGNPVAYAPHLRKDPLAGVPAKSVIIQFAKGDQLVPNPTTTALLRAGDLADRATYYRNDLAFADDPNVPKNPHGFMVSIGSSNPLVAAIARGAQEQIATFFASDGATIIHPEPAKYFEVPIQGPLPEDLNYIP